MDEILGVTEQPTEETTEEIVRHFATIGAVYEDGVSLIFDGEDAPTEKHYLCNTSAFFSAGDRVKILPDSGTYVVEYVVGSPKQQRTVGLPSGGVEGQILQKMSDAEFHAAWQTLQGLLPTGGSAGQFLKKSSATNYAVTWGDMDEVAGTLPKGGSAGQFLVKSSVTDYAAGWQTAYTVPSGGSAGQILTKDSATAGDVSWQTAYMIPTGGTEGQVLTKASSTAGDVSWQTPSVTGGLPTGGSTGQLLQKSGTSNYAASWVTGYLIPSGGSAGQVLTKDTTTAGDVSWQDAPQSSRAVGVQNQYSSTTQGSDSYRIQFRTNGTYGTGAKTFQIRLGTGAWFTLTTT